MHDTGYNALVTGATGFIGSHIADELLARGYKVRCTYRKTSDLRWIKGKNFELHETDLYDKDSIKAALQGIDFVFHAAGSVRAWNYEGYLNGNLIPTKNILESCLEESIDLKRFVYVSSQTVTGPSKSYDKPMKEEDASKPISPYAKSKKAAEEFVLKNSKNLPVTIIRPPGVFGPRDTAIYSLFRIISMHIAPYFGFSDKYVSLIYVKDLARGTINAAEFENTKGQIYFLAYDDFFSYRDLFDHVKSSMNGRFTFNVILPEIIVKYSGYVSELFGRLKKDPPVFNYYKGQDFVQKYWTCSVEKAKKDFNFEIKYPIDKAIKETTDWYLSEGWLK